MTAWIIEVDDDDNADHDLKAIDAKHSYYIYDAKETYLPNLMPSSSSTLTAMIISQ